MLPPAAPRKPGDVDIARVVGLAKLEDCTALREAATVLTGAETMAVLSDARGLDRLAALDCAQPSLKNVK